MYDSKKKKRTHLQSITYFPLIKYIYMYFTREQRVKIDRKIYATCLKIDSKNI